MKVHVRTISGATFLETSVPFWRMNEFVDWLHRQYVYDGEGERNPLVEAKQIVLEEGEESFYEVIINDREEE